VQRLTSEVGEDYLILRNFLSDVLCGVNCHVCFCKRKLISDDFRATPIQSQSSTSVAGDKENDDGEQKSELNDPRVPHNLTVESKSFVRRVNVRALLSNDECLRRKYLLLLRIDSYESAGLNTQINHML